jgi:predicted transcriptional regulator with HTH domain
MIEQLFGSKTRVKLLKLFFSNPNRSFYVREITRIVDEQINSVRRELANLLSLGIIVSDSSNNKLYYEVNQKYEHFKSLQNMFSEIAVEDTPVEGEVSEPVQMNKTKPSKETVSAADSGVVELPEARHWAKAGNIVGIAYSGVYTRDESAGVDILIIGNAVVSKIESVVTLLEKEKNRELRYAIIEPDEWKYRRQVRDKFWLQFMGAKMQVVLDKEEVFSNK